MANRIDPSLIHVRNYAPTDEAYLYATWIRGLYSDSQWSMVDDDTIFRSFHALYHSLLARIIEDPATRIQMLALNDDPDVILAYVVYEPRPQANSLHWIYTRLAWRRMGLARILLEPLGITEVTHLTKLGKAIKPEAWAYNPMMKSDDEKTEVEPKADGRQEPPTQNRHASDLSHPRDEGSSGDEQGHA